MGHHYWTMSRDMTPAEFTAVGEAARRIFEACSLDLASGQSGPNSPPIITGDVIRFNGSEQPGGLDFVLKRCIDPVDLTPLNREHFVTCRTYRLPYGPGRLRRPAGGQGADGPGRPAAVECTAGRMGLRLCRGAHFRRDALLGRGGPEPRRASGMERPRPPGGTRHSPGATTGIRARFAGPDGRAIQCGR